METTEDGSSQPANVHDEEEEGEEEEESGASVDRLPDSNAESPVCYRRRPGPSDDNVDRRLTDRHCECGESFSGDAAEAVRFRVQPRCVCAGVACATMLDLVAESSSSAVTSHVASDGVYSDCSGNGLRRASQSGGSGSLDGQPRSCPGEVSEDGSTGARPNHNNLSIHQSSCDTTNIQSIQVTLQDEDLSAEGLNAICSQTMPSPIEELKTKHYNGRHQDKGSVHSAGSEALSLPNGDCLSDLQGASDLHLGIGTGVNKAATVEAKLPNGGLMTGDSCSSGALVIDSTVPCYPGENIVSSCSHSQLDTPSSPSASESKGSSRTDALDNSGPRAQQDSESQFGASSGSDSQGIIKQTPPSSILNTDAVPSWAPVASTQEDDQEDDDETGEAGEAASGLGLSYHGTPEPSCDSAPRSPGSQLEDGSDEAFAEPQPGHQRFVDVSLCSRNTYECNRRQSAPGQLPHSEGFGAGDPSDPALQSRRPGIAEYFGRGLFSRKQRAASQSAPGWKLFGKVPPRESPTKNSKTIQQEYEARQVQTTAGNSPTHHAAGRSRKNLEFEPLSTTALILEDRPANLPAKSVEEAQRHRQEYDEMVAEAKKRELKEAQRRQRQMKERFKQEENIANAMVVWNNDILPHWDTMKSSRRARDLWWQGLPPNIRGRVWSLAIGNELNITPELYGIFLSRAKEKWRTFGETGSEGEAEDGASLADRESSLELIKLDISRTFPSLYIFQKGGPYHDLLHSILGAYTCYRPDVGYVQGMSFIAAVLILNMEEADAFISFANLLNKPCQMAFFRVDHELMLKYFGAFEVFFEENLPRLFGHFQSSGLTPDLYLIDWIFSLYTKPLPLDVACRVWDVFCRDGEEFLFRTGLGILRLYQDVLLQMDFIHIAQFLARLPDEELLSDRLFSCIAATPMLSGNRKWSQVFSWLMKDPKDTEKNAGAGQKS
ncbi:TBC1 domain family member 12-like isoform 2-T2 [Polymixia lowei]